MSRHVTKEDLAQLRAGTLAPRDAQWVLGHRASCPDCRALTSASPGASVEALRALLGFEPAELEPSPELEVSPELEESECGADSDAGEQQLVDFVVGRLDPAVAARLARHIESCERCQAIVAELREDQASLGAASVESNLKPLASNAHGFNAHRSNAHRSNVKWVAIAAGLAILLAGAAWKLLQKETPVERIQDGAVTLALNKSGEWSGMEGLPRSGRDAILEALRTRKLPAPSEPPWSPPPRGELRGAPAPAAFELLSPAYARVEQTRPRFSWTAVPDARSYRVAVFTMDMKIVETSGALPPHQTSWEPAKELPRAQRLAWQVTAERIGADALLAPAPPAPQVFFEVVSEEVAHRIDEARPSHLLLAAVYARHGMKLEARRELEVLAAQNPQSGLIRTLLQSL